MLSRLLAPPGFIQHAFCRRPMLAVAGFVHTGGTLRSNQPEALIWATPQRASHRIRAGEWLSNDRPSTHTLKHIQERTTELSTVLDSSSLVL